MAKHLVGKAEYQEDGDVILASVHLYDDVSHSYHPELVKRGTLKFFRGATIISQRDFDSRFGNGPPSGGFHFDLAHPVVTDGLVLDVSVTLQDGDTYAVRSAVTRYSDPSTSPPLASQPDVAVNTYGLTKG